MVDFSTLKALTIPEGEVKRIESGGVKLWEAGGGDSVYDLYQRVEYITTAGSGTSRGWFLTDFIANNQSGLEFTWSVSSFSDTAFFGSTTGGTNARCYVFYPRTTTVGYHGWNTAISATVTTAANTVYTSRLNWLNNRKAILLDANGNTKSTKSLTGTLVQQVSPIAICRYNNKTSTPTSSRPVTVCSARCSQGTEIVRAYYPCYRKSDGEIGLLETLTGHFEPSKVANGFTKGPDIDWDI